MREFVKEDSANWVGETSVIFGQEPLPEPYESAARMVYGDPLHNEAFASLEKFGAKTLHRWRQRPELIARVRFLALSQRRRFQVSTEQETRSNH